MKNLKVFPNFFKKNFKLFSTVNLRTFQGVRTFDDSSLKMNWSLAKYWITSKSKVHFNSIKKEELKNNSANDTVVKTAKVGDITHIQFERFHRKIGALISEADNVYVQQGKVGGKAVRVIGSNKDDVALFSSLFEGSSDLNDFVDVNVLYLINHPELKTKQFNFYDVDKKIILSSTNNLESIRKIVDEL